MLFSLRRLIRGKKKEYRTNESITEDIISAYNETRVVKNKDLLCHAPFSNLYFNTEGDVAVCWKTFHVAEKYDESKSIMDIWQSENFKKIRQNVEDETLNYSCQACRKHLEEGNFVNVLSKAYDLEEINEDMPSIIELELSNRCNLACVMCNGHLSSTIRRDREGLSPLQSPYGDKFVEDLRPFLPHLKEIRFNGGEPFLIKIYYKIWDLIFELNPQLKIVIATNGTVLNDKIKSYLSKGNFHINLSIDGIHADTYENIRVRGEFDKVMENFKYFHEYCATHKRTLCIMVNPMRNNWQEMPEFIEFCNQHDVHIWFNTIEKPAHLALWSLPSKDLQQIYQQLSDYPFESYRLLKTAIQKYNIRTYKNFVNQQIKTWCSEALKREENKIIEANKTIETVLDILKEKIQKESLVKKIEDTISLLDTKSLQINFVESIIQSNDQDIEAKIEQLTVSEMYQLFLNHLSK
ncbi:MAG: twitch domain-containing radical SAM protein [Chitinophagales bacterium]|nr:twitch domain-containing radical SAM protein [Chitinophagales bacterium]